MLCMLQACCRHAAGTLVWDQTSARENDFFFFILEKLLFMYSYSETRHVLKKHGKGFQMKGVQIGRGHGVLVKKIMFYNQAEIQPMVWNLTKKKIFFFQSREIFLVIAVVKTRPVSTRAWQGLLDNWGNTMGKVIGSCWKSHVF